MGLQELSVFLVMMLSIPCPLCKTLNVTVLVTGEEEPQHQMCAERAILRAWTEPSAPSSNTEKPSTLSLGDHQLTLRLYGLSPHSSPTVLLGGGMQFDPANKACLTCSLVRA